MSSVCAGVRTKVQEIGISIFKLDVRTCISILHNIKSVIQKYCRALLQVDFSLHKLLKGNGNKTNLHRCVCVRARALACVLYARGYLAHIS